MKITEIASFRVVSEPFPDDPYIMSGGRRVEELASTVVRVTADNGLQGYGEACTLGGNYVDGFPSNIEAAVTELAPTVFRTNPLDAGALVSAMDQHLLGQRGAKSAIDIALWDLRGKYLEQPVARLLGGVKQESFGAFIAVGMDAPSATGGKVRELAELGFRKWQLKLGDDPLEDAARTHAAVQSLPEGSTFLTSDANKGWNIAQTLRYLRAIEGVDTYLEQPVPTLAELEIISQRTSLPILVDEIVRDVPDLLDAIRAGCAHGLNLKPTRVGGLTKAARLRDIAEAAGVGVLVDEPMGADLATAAMTQLSATVEPNLFLATSYLDFPGMPLTYRASGDDMRFPLVDGEVRWHDAPGLGVTIDEQTLGDPVAVLRN